MIELIDFLCAFLLGGCAGAMFALALAFWAPVRETIAFLAQGTADKGLTTQEDKSTRKS